MVKSEMLKPGKTVIQLNNIDQELRNRFKGLCAFNGSTLKDGILKVMRIAIDANTLELTGPTAS